MSALRKILLVDDDTDHLVTYHECLSEHFDVSTTTCGNDAVKKGSNEDYDAIIIDIHMPEKDGIKVFEEIREKNKNVALIFLTGYKDYNFQTAHELGADDIIDKPIDCENLIAAINNRITSRENSKKVLWQGVTLDLARNSLTNEKDQTVDLTLKECLLLQRLMERPGQFHSKEEILAEIWSATTVNPKTVDAHLSNLRSKIAPLNVTIETSRLYGMKMKDRT